MNSKVITAVAGSVIAFGLHAEMPVIPQESVVFNQNSNNRLVTISYELQEAPAIVTVDILAFLVFTLIGRIHGGKVK